MNGREEDVMNYVENIVRSTVFDPSIVRTKLSTALHVASYLGHRELADRIGDKINQFDKEQRELVEAIVNCPDMEG